MKSLILAIVFALPFYNIQAQHTISGLVTDKKDNSLLLEGVKVFVPEFDRTGETEAGGTYLLGNIGVGTVHVQFSKEGYRTELITVNTSDSATVVNAELRKDDGRPDHISAGPFTRLIANTPFPVVRYDGNEIRRRGNTKYLTSLAYEPGVDVITIGQISRPVIRGLSGNHILMVQSGSRILSNRLDERYDYELMDDGTSEIEIIKGPAALLYGDNAMGGVLIFKDELMPPPGTVNGDVSLAFYTNTLGLISHAGVKGTTVNRLFYSFRFGGNSQTSYIQGEGFQQKKNTEIRKYAYNSGSVSADAKAIIGITRKWGESKISATYWKRQNELVQSYSDVEVLTLDQTQERDRKTMTPFVGQESVLLSMQNTILLKKSKINADVSWQSYRREGDYTTGAVNYDVKYTSDPSRRMGFSAGTQGYLQNKDYAAYYSIYKNKIISSGFYALYRFDTGKINVLAGARYDFKHLTTQHAALDDDYSYINGSAGIAYHPVNNITLKLNGSSGNSFPDEERNYFNDVYYGYLVSVGASDEINREGDFGFEWRHPAITLNFSAFYNFVDNYSFVDFFPGVDQLYALYRQDAVFKGGEAKVSIHPQSVQWINAEAGYSTVRGKFEGPDLNVPHMPADKITAVLRFQSKRMNYLYNSYIEIMARSYMKQDKIYRTEFPTEGYTLVDFRLGGTFHWGLQEFDVTIAINNLLDEEYFSHLSLLKNLSPVPVAEMGRNVALMVKFPFGISQGK